MRLFSPLALAAMIAASPAFAQDAGWDYRTTVYLWLPGISSTVETPKGTAEADVSAGDALSALDMGFMGSVAAQNGPWVLWGDLVYTDLSATNPTPHGLAFSEVTTKSRMTAVTLYALYDVNPAPEVQLAFGAGVRAFDMSLETTLSGGVGGAGGNFTQSGSDSWLVPVLAAQAFAPINDRWYVTGVADWGKTGNDNETWQVYAGVGYRINENWSTQLGYRYMDLSKDIDNSKVELGMGGVLLGMTYEF